MNEQDQPRFAHVATGRSGREWAVRLALLLGGLMLTQFGVALFILSRQGSDPFTIFVQGLSVTTGLSIGAWHVIVQIVLLAVMLALTTGYIKPGTLVCVFCGGPFIDTFSWLLRDAVTPLGGAIRFLIMVLGTCIMSMGVSLVVTTDAGAGTNDLVSVILTDKLKRFQFRWVRITVDTVITVVGYLLGGVFGLGTLAGTFLVGPVIQLFFPLWTRVVSWSVRTFAPRPQS